MAEHGDDQDVSSWQEDLSRRIRRKQAELTEGVEIVLESGTFPPPPQGQAITPGHIRHEVVKSMFRGYPLCYALTGQQLWETYWAPRSPGLFDKVWKAIRDAVEKYLKPIHKVFSKLTEFLQELVKTLWGVVQKVLEGVWDLLLKAIIEIMDLFGQVVQPIIKALQRLYEWVEHKVGRVADVVWDWLTKYWPWVVGVVVLAILAVLIIYLGPEIVELLKPVWEPLAELLGPVFGNIIGFLGQNVVSLGRLAVSGFRAFQEVWTGLISPVFNSLGTALGAISPVIDLLPEKLQAKVALPFIDTMSTIWSSGEAIFNRVDFTLSTVTPALQGVAQAYESSLAAYGEVQSWALEDTHQRDRYNYAAQEELTRETLSTLLTPTEDGIRYSAQLEAESALRQQMAQILEDAPEGAGKVQAWFMQKFVWFKDWIAGTAETVINGLQTAIAGYKPATPYLSHANAAQALLFCVGAGALAHGMATAAEIIHPFKWMGVHYLSAFMVQMGGFGLVTSQTMGQLLRRAVGVPYGYALNEDYRPYIPRENMLQIMAVKPDIRIEDFRMGMRWWGYRDEWIDAIERTMYHEPRYFELSMMASDENATPSWLYKKARRAGYNAEDAEIFAESIVKKALSRERQEYTDSLTRLYQEGFITQEQYDEHLLPLGLSEEAHYLLKRAARFKYLYSYTQDMISYFTQLYEAAVISLEEFVDDLEGLGLRPDAVTMIANRSQLKVEKKTLKEEQAEIEKVIREEQRIYIRRYVEMYRAGSIPKMVLVSNLITLGLTPTYASAVADIEEQKKLGRERKTILSSVESEERRIREQYRTMYEIQFEEDKITADQLEARLLQAGYSPEEAASMRALQEAKKEKAVAALKEADQESTMSSLRKSYMRQYVDLYREAKISEDQLRGYLKAWGFSDEEIEEILTREQEILELQGE